MKQKHLDLLRAGKLWHRLIAADPSDEPAQRAHMQTALDDGNRAKAIRLFNQLRQSLQLELGLGPSSAAVRLYEKALAIPAVDPVSQTDRIAGMWHGGPWMAAVWEARGAQQRAEGSANRAVAALEEAASRLRRSRPPDRSSPLPGGIARTS